MSTVYEFGKHGTPLVTTRNDGDLIAEVIGNIYYIGQIYSVEYLNAN